MIAMEEEMTSISALFHASNLIWNDPTFKHET